MDFRDFVKDYDNENAIILLEGKRVVHQQDIEKLIALGQNLASQMKYATFRSGNAKGADYYFSQGISMIDQQRLQVITPYSKHRNKENQAYETLALDDVNLAEEPEVVYQSKRHRSTKNLVDRFVSGDRDRFAIKASYILRDTIKVIGAKSILPTTFGIFYDDLDKPRTGGTGHTMNICEINGIPFIDQSVWFNWLDP